MAVTTARWAAIIDDLVAQATAALPTVYVYDGPPKGRDGQDRESRLWIGTTSADLGTGGLAVETTQEWRNTRGMTRDEVGLIYCIAEGYAASFVMKAARDLAVATVAAIETLLRPGTATTPQLGGSLWGELVESRPEQYQMDSGAFCRVPFTLSFTSYLAQS